MSPPVAAKRTVKVVLHKETPGLSGALLVSLAHVARAPEVWLPKAACSGLAFAEWDARGRKVYALAAPEPLLRKKGLLPERDAATVDLFGGAA